MDFWKLIKITYCDQRIWNPLSDAKVDDLVEFLQLPLGGRILDIACGPGEVLCRAAQRWSAHGIGVDVFPWVIGVARETAVKYELADRVEIIEGDGAKFEGDAESFDASMCLGASWIWNGHRGTLEALGRWTKRGGTIVTGQPFWIREPSPDHLKASGFSRESYHSHRGNVEVGTESGLRFLRAIVSSTDDWDRFEGDHFYAAEKYAHEHPDDPDSAALRDPKFVDTYLRWGRDEMGWAVYFFLKP